MATLTKNMTKEEIFQLKNRLSPFILKESTPQYTYYQIKTKECSITAYTSGKVVFQGADLSWLEPATPQKEAQDQAGSDEVGTGDYFGPVVVCACYVSKESYLKIKHLGIQDSKQLDDTTIRNIAPTLMEEVPYSVLIVDNAKYNHIHKQHNLNAIKALLHNQAYKHLEKKIKQLPELNVVDQFAPENLYYNYLKNEKEVIRKLHFETKAESKYLAVACASVIARYTFLQVFDNMEEIYGFTFPKGSGELVDQAIVQFVKRFGKDKLNEVAKLHFKNTQKRGCNEIE